MGRLVHPAAFAVAVGLFFFVGEFVAACGPWLAAPHAPWAPSQFDPETFAAAAPLAQTRVAVLSEITALVDFLFYNHTRGKNRSEHAALPWRAGMMGARGVVSPDQPALRLGWAGRG